MVRSSVIFFLGNLLLALAGFMLVCAFWSLARGEPDFIYLLISVVITGLAGIILRVILPGKKDISLSGSFTLVALAWILAGLFGALPFYLYGVFDSYLASFFEAVSGFTTTGATLIEDIESQPEGILLWRSMTQWLGGMGIIVLFVAFLPRMGIRGINLVKAELPGPITDRVVPRVAQMAKWLWIIYFALTVILCIMLLLSGISFFLSINHALTTMPTGGFSPLNDSIAGLGNPPAEIIITVFMIFAGINFALYYMFLKGDYRAFWRNEEFRFFLGMVLVSMIVVSVSLFSFYEVGEAFRKGCFQVASILTTTGYATADFNGWAPFLRTLLLFFMFIGGMGGSTSGSMKQARLLLLLKVAIREIYRLVHPSSVTSIKLGKKVVSEEVLRNVSGFVFLFLVLHVISTLALSAMGLNLESAFSASIASIGNVGPGLDMVGPEETYQVVPSGGRLLLSLMMIVGRLEIFTVLIFFTSLIRRY